MRILLANDDGIQSASLRALAQALTAFAEVIVVAPLHEQSGVGHAFSYFNSLRYGKAEDYPCEAYWLKGTPSDCTKFAICEILKDRTPDLVISGPNNGENAGVAVVYSGTVAAAREAALWNYPAIALSLQMTRPHILNRCISWVCHAVQSGLWKRIHENTYWTLNFPDVANEAYKGIKVCPLSTIMFVDEYKTLENPRGHAEYWITGFKDRPSFPKDSDDDFLAQGYATLTPLTVDQTAHTALQQLATFSDLLDTETR